jgi:predicted PurR-regulated permease PerM
MTPEIITYLICGLTFLYLAVTAYTFFKSRRLGTEYQVRIFYVLAAAIVFLISVYAIATGQTYDDLVTAINDMFG